MIMKIKTNLRNESKSELIRAIRNMQEAIKLDCYDCMCGCKKKDCLVKKCSLYKYRPWAKQNVFQED